MSAEAFIRHSHRQCSPQHMCRGDIRAFLNKVAVQCDSEDPRCKMVQKHHWLGKGAWLSCMAVHNEEAHRGRRGEGGGVLPSAAMARRDAANFSERRFATAAGRTSGVGGRGGGVHAHDQVQARDSVLASRSAAAGLGS